MPQPNNHAVRRPAQPVRKPPATVASPVRSTTASKPASMSQAEIIRGLKAKNDRLEAQNKQLKGIAVSMRTASTKSTSIPARTLADFSTRLLDVLNGKNR